MALSENTHFEIQPVAKTLDEWFPNGRGDGRKFCPIDRPDFVVEPIIRTCSPANRNEDSWFILRDEDFLDSYDSRTFHQKFIEYVPPKKSKKIKLYRPIYMNGQGGYYIANETRWTSEKSDYAMGAFGWIEKEVEINV